MFPKASYAFRALYGVWLIACRRTELITYNWASVPLGYMFAVATVLNNFLSMVPFLGIFLLTTVYAVAICLFFEIARQGLKVSRLSAIGVVVFDFIFSISLMSVLGSIKSQI